MEDARKLLDNGWQILIFRDGLGQYTALAAKEDESVDAALDAWEEADDPPDDGELIESCIEHAVMGGANRYAGCGLSVAHALHALTEKVLFRRVPKLEGGQPL